MNKRIKKKKRYSYLTGTAKTRKYNKWLCKRYPFLIPRNVWTDKIMWGRDKYFEARYGHKEYIRFRRYSYTLVDEFMTGWWKAFGLLLCEELRDDLIKCGYLYKFRFEQIKEKYGELRAYFAGVPRESDAFNIIEKYTYLSNYICQYCGKPDTHQIDDGWIMTICEDCYNKMNNRRKKYRTTPIIYNNIPGADKDATMPTVRKVTRFSKEGSETIEYDITETVNKIRAKWRG